ncbi:MAG: hypothetical protein Roseis2KO_02250 [Roseivirga sp.]
MSIGEFNRPGLNQSLADLRVVILRTISDVWRDDNDREKSKENHSSYYATLLTRLMATAAPEKFNRKLRPYTYRIVVELIKLLNPGKYSGKYRRITEQANPNNLKRLFYAHFSINPRHPHFGIQFTKPKSHWNVYGDHQWTKIGTDSFYISLPVQLPPDLNDLNQMVKYDGQFQLDPKHRFEYYKTAILTDYFKAFPHILGEHRAQTARKPKNSEFIVLKRDDNFPEAPLHLVAHDDSIDRVFKKQQTDTIDAQMQADNIQAFNEMLILLLPVLWNNPVLSKRLNYAQRLFNTTTLLDDYYTVKRPNKKTWEEEWKKNRKVESKRKWGRNWEWKLDGKWKKAWRKELKKKLKQWRPTEVSINNLHELSFYLATLQENKAKELAEFDKAYANELNHILQNHFHYPVPPGVDIKFIMPEWQVFFYERHTRQSKKRYYRFKINPGEILNLATLEIPHRPDYHSTASVSLALARYSNQISELLFNH